MTTSELSKALKPIETQLRRIADALEAVVSAPEPEPEGPTCPHPEESRLQMGPGWICQDCQHVEMPSRQP